MQQHRRVAQITQAEALAACIRKLPVRRDLAGRDPARLDRASHVAEDMARTEMGEIVIFYVAAFRRRALDLSPVFAFHLRPPVNRRYLSLMAPPDARYLDVAAIKRPMRMCVSPAGLRVISTERSAKGMERSVQI